MRLTIACLAACLAGCPLPSRSAVLHVPQDYATLADALAANQPGDTVEVAPGVHPVIGTLNLDFGVTLRAAQPDQARLLSVGGGACLFSLAGWPPCRIENLEIGSASGGPLVESDGALVELAQCRLVGGARLHGAGLALTACDLDSMDSVGSSNQGGGLVFYSCRFRDCGTLDWADHPQLILENCLIERLGGLGNVGWVSYDEGVIALHGCTLVDCGGYGPFAGTSLDRLEMTRCIIRGQHGLILGSGNMVPDQMEVSNTDIWGASQGNWAGALAPFLGYQGNIEEDPLFCDPASGNYRVAWDSPCVLDEETGDVMGALPPGCGPRILACSAVPAAGRMPLEVTFSCSLDDSCATAGWDFTDDGVADASGLQATWTFMQRGDHGVTLHAANAAGEVVLDTLVIHVVGVDIHVPEDAFWLETALAQALPGDVVWLAAGAYPCHDLIVPAGVSIRGVAGATVLDAGEQGRCLTLQVGCCDTELEGLDLVDGRAGQGGALFLEAAAPGASPVVRISNCLFRANQAQSLGGAIAVAWQGPRLTLDSCRFQGNAAGWGGACYGGALQARACRFEDNRAALGGALAGQDSLELEDCAFVGNQAIDLGGAVAAAGPGASRVAGCRFLRNRAGQDGAALWFEHSAQVSHCSFWGDSTAATGAVLCLGGPAPRLEGCIVANALGGRALAGSAGLTITCTDLWANADGDWTPPWDDQAGQAGNLHDDPLFCDPAWEELGLMVFSPCNWLNSACGRMGASDSLCDFTALEPVRPAQADLAPAWPNPFNPVTRLSFTLARPGEVRLGIHNLAGQEVAVPAQGLFTAGTHQTLFDGSACASGLYLAVLQSAEGTSVQKLLLVK